PARYTLSLHDALPIWGPAETAAASRSTRRAVRPLGLSDRAGRFVRAGGPVAQPAHVLGMAQLFVEPGEQLLQQPGEFRPLLRGEDRKSTRLNSSHVKT